MSGKFLQPRANENLRGSDTLSDISETDTANSEGTSCWDLREDLREFVTKIGLNDVSDLYQDRFRVDRKKLEQMLSGDNEAPIPADIFFEQIMADTGTYITWPSKLKIGAKSKKDPHVRIAGKQEDVVVAKERIMTVLDTRCNRVTMKMDVSYTDHSHIIGKGGLSIKRVMEETKCHVHFPDSNRSNPSEKSNQVSIAGDIKGVELARSRVRQKTPVVFGFELPIMSENVEATNPYILNIQEQFNVLILLRTRPKLHATLVMVKGVEWEIEQVKKATTLLVEYLCKNLANQIPIQMTIEISPHHHQIVIGKSYANLKEIMKVTGAQIMFPDAQDPNIPNLKKSNVTITGNINNVYAARQLLIGSLPLLLMFDLPEYTNNLPIKPDQIAEIQRKYDVTINIRMKAKQNTLACIIKGVERSASNIYKARNVILGSHDTPIVADIPPTYNMPKAQAKFTVAQDQAPATMNPPQPISPIVSPLVSPVWHYQQPSYNQSTSGYFNMLHQQQFLFNNAHHHQVNNNRYIPQGQCAASSLAPHDYNRERDNTGSLPTTSTMNLNTHSSMGSPKNQQSVYHNRSTETSPNETSGLGNVFLSPSYQQTSTETKQERKNSLTFDYEQNRVAGFKAMQSRISGGYRYPTKSWSGYGISHTSPGMFQSDRKSSQSDEVWTTPSPKEIQSFDIEYPETTAAADLNMSSYLDHTPTNVVEKLITSKWPDLETMLTAMGLEKYLSLLVSHEIDLTTFASMTDKDLVDIGVTAFGARRKMRLAIAELKKRSHNFSPAPGAERKSSSDSMTPKGKW